MSEDTDILVLLDTLLIQGYNTLAALSYEARKELPDRNPKDVEDMCRRFLRDKSYGYVSGGRSFGETNRY